jgi:hypothetical protein
VDLGWQRVIDTRVQRPDHKDLLDGHLDRLRDATYRKYFGID